MLRSPYIAEGRSSVRVSKFDQMQSMQQGCLTVLCSTGKTRVWNEKVLDLWQVCQARRSQMLHSARIEKRKKRDRSEEEEKSGGLFDTECRENHHEDDEPIKESLTDLLFFDFECRQENGTHEPNLCIVQNEAGDEWIFQGDTTQNDFCEWLFSDEHIGCTVMAHNFQGYDSYFILQYLREQGVMYEVIMRGGKTLSLEVPMFGIKFIDSLNFIPMKLANFPKTFGIEELATGYFPHPFNKKENENYVGPIPPAPYYSPNWMSPKDRETFLAWHASKKESDYVFDFKEEIVTYFQSDVDILRRCFFEFRELFHEVTDIDPFRYRYHCVCVS